jgi:hypothetical protein
MALDKQRRGWRPRPKRNFGFAPRVFGAWSASLFNLCLFALPLAGAIALILIVRDDLYTYPLTQGSARAARAHIERISADLIQLDFDRRGQWDDLIAMELMDRDISAARGFLLSGRTMLAGRDGRAIDRAAHDDGDAAIELAALDLVTPGTRARYESSVPLLSRYSDAARRAGQNGSPETLGDARDFELLAETALGDPSDDMSRLTLTGLSLGLGETLSPRQRAGAIVLVDAMRRADFSPDMFEAVNELLAGVLPPARFRTEAQSRAASQNESGGRSVAAYPTSAPAFRAAFNRAAWAPLRDTLEDAGAMSEATSPMGAALMLSHAQTLRDVPRLRLVAEAGRDRAVAAAKRAPRDGRLADAAPGQLRLTQPLIMAFAIAGLACFGLAWCLITLAWISIAPLIQRHFGEDERHDLVTHFNAPWRVL